MSGVLPAFSQCTYTLSGKVIDSHDKEALAFASIYIKENGMGVISDSLGNYVISGLCEGTYNIRCSHLGCEDVFSKVKIKGDTRYNFYPEHHAEELKAIRIIAKRAEEKSTQAKSDLSERDLNETKGEPLGESLKRIAGVTSVQTGASVSKPVIHGLHSNRVLIVNNGVRQEGQQWGSEHGPEIDPFIANTLTVIKGANSVRYGSDAIAGVILVEPKALRDTAGIGGEVNLVGSTNNRQGVLSGIVEQNFEKIPALSWRLQGTLKQAGNVKTPDYYLKNTGLKEYNFSGAVGWDKQTYGMEAFYSQFNTTLGIFSGSHIGNLSDLENAFNRARPGEEADFSYTIDRPYQHVEHELFKVKSFVNTGAIGTLNLVYARQYNVRYEYDKHKPLKDALADLNLPELQYTITTHSADLIWEHKPVRSFRGSIGMSGITQGNTYSGRYFIPNYRNYSGGLFLIERWRKNKIELEAGIRYDYRWLQIFKYEDHVIISPINKYDNFSGTAGAIYRFNEHLLLNCNIGTAWRAPAVSELYSNGLHHGAAAVEIGDSKLVAENALNTIATLSYTAKKVDAEISLYHNSINNFIYLQPALPPSLTIRGAFPTFQYTQADATFTGIDASIDYRIIKAITLSSKASVLRAFNKSAGDYLVSMPSDRFENEITYNIKDFKRVRKSYASVSVSTILKQSRVPANSDFAPPPEGYTLLNFNMGLTFYIGGQQVEGGLTINNVLNTVYREYLNRFRYYSDEMGRNILLRLRIPMNFEHKKN